MFGYINKVNGGREGNSLMGRERGLQSKIHTILLGLILTSDELSLLGENDDGEKEA